MRILKKLFLSFLPVLFLLAAVCTPLPASAAGRPVKISTCQLASAARVSVTATLADTREVSGNICYLFALSFSDVTIPAGMKPLTLAKKAEKMAFSVNLNNSKPSSLLYSRFVVASRNSAGAYTTVSDSNYISNPKKAAKYTYRFPTSTSKKGLQVSASMLEDAIDLNVRHSALNIVFSDLISPAAEQNRTLSIPYKYHGKTYWFRKALVNSYDAQLTALRENSVTVSAILLLGWRKDLQSLIYPTGREAGHAFYAWNTANAAAREQLQATLSFLASRYGSLSAPHGRIVNWIVGNEVNNYGVYNYAGQKSLKQYAKIYADAFRLTYNTVTSIYANARVYISLDHLWNTRVKGCFSSRETLDAFAAVLKCQGNIGWNLAFHPYSSPLTEPRFWANADGQARQALTSPVISMANLNILTSYIRQKYGPDTRIILSEQGYTSVRHITVRIPKNPDTNDTQNDSKAQGKNDISEKNDSQEMITVRREIDAQKEQSAAIAYSYYLAEADDMIDSFIMNRHVDHQVEIDQGLDLGLWTTTPSNSLPEWANTKKDSWQVFKYMDSNKAENVTSRSLSVIGIKSWTDVIPDYTAKLYCKNVYSSSALIPVGSYRISALISQAWRAYGAVSSSSATKNTVTVRHNRSRNRNSLWGFSQTFTRNLNFSYAPYFYTTLNVHGATAAKAKVTIRFCSGLKILECSRIISCDQPVRLGVSLQKWNGKNAVKKIQVLISPVSGGWTNSAYVTMRYPVIGK